MKKKILLLFIAVLLLSLRASADEEASYTITITIPQIIEHCDQPAQIAQNNKDEKAGEEKSKDSNLYVLPEPVVIVKTLQ